MAAAYMFIDGAYLDACINDFSAKWFGELGELDYAVTPIPRPCVAGNL